MPDTAISFRHVGKTFAKSNRPAIGDLDFEVASGEYVCVVGRTGCGKSTTVNLLLGLDTPTSGDIAVLGHNPVRDFQKLRGRIGCIFQSDRLLPWRTAIDNVRVPLDIIGNPVSSRAPTPEESLKQVGLSGYEQAYPHELSGGMRQRVAIARALVSDPDLLIADEAFGHLDEVTAHTLRQTFKDIATAGGKTVVQITHSIAEAVALADRILVFGRPGHVAAEFRVRDYIGETGRDRLATAVRKAIEGVDGQASEAREETNRPAFAHSRSAAAV